MSNDSLGQLGVVGVIYELRHLFDSELLDNSYLTLKDKGSGQWWFFFRKDHVNVEYSPRVGRDRDLKFTCKEKLSHFIREEVYAGIDLKAKALEDYIQKTTKGFSDVYKEIDSLKFILKEK